MYRIPNAWLLLFCLGLTVAIFSPKAYATLGGPASSVESDRRVLSATKRAANFCASFTVHEMVSQSTVVREYVSTSGTVFAIAWNGSQPDLSQLLGSYAEQYREALHVTKRQPGVRRSIVKGPDVIVENWGHMRNLRGRAYAPALIPSGVTLDDIQ